MNGVRRHLTPSQRAVVAVKLLPELKKEAKGRQQESGGDRKTTTKKIGSGNVSTTDSGRSRDQAAAIVNVNPRYVSDAEKLKTDAPDLFEEVASGAMTLPKAKKKHKQDVKVKEESMRIVNSFES